MPSWAEMRTPERVWMALRVETPRTATPSWLKKRSRGRENFTRLPCLWVEDRPDDCVDNAAKPLLGAGGGRFGILTTAC
jgi:hypothetical protein